MMHGKGELSFDEGRQTYEGHFKEGLMHGEGERRKDWLLGNKYLVENGNWEFGENVKTKRFNNRYNQIVTPCQTIGYTFAVY